jgi:hypothetical protein
MSHRTVPCIRPLCRTAGVGAGGNVAHRQDVGGRVEAWRRGVDPATQHSTSRSCLNLMLCKWVMLSCCGKCAHRYRPALPLHALLPPPAPPSPLLHSRAQRYHHQVLRQHQWQQQRTSTVTTHQRHPPHTCHHTSWARRLPHTIHTCPRPCCCVKWWW